MFTQDNVVSSWLPLINLAVETWPEISWPHWHMYDDSNALKYTTKDSHRLTLACSRLVGNMIDYVSKTDLDLSRCFPDLDLYGAGMHMMKPGGYLNSHVDSEVHPFTGWYRKYSTILFLTECEGGNLVIQKGDMEKVVEPVPGRIVTLSSCDRHRVEKVVSGDRLTLSIFWWSKFGTGTVNKAAFGEPYESS